MKWAAFLAHLLIPRSLSPCLSRLLPALVSLWHAERAIALEGGLDHNAAANDAALAGLSANEGMGEAIDASFTSHSGGNAAANDAVVDEV